MIYRGLSVASVELINITKIFRTSGLEVIGSLLDSLIGLDSDIGFPPAAYHFSIENLNLKIPEGKTMAILGPSGCGKTTLLKLVAGLLKPDSGEIRFDGKNMAGIPPGDRKIGMIFQNYALYPTFTSKQNILAYFIFRKKTPELRKMSDEKFQRTSELLGVDIAYLLYRKPKNLSPGEKQRVALGRCITRDPSLFLLDEPFSSLDQNLREKYRVSLKVLLDHFHITTIYVTHDQQEAFILGDLIAVMNRGRIEQVGIYEELYTRPRNIFVAEFLNLEIETPSMNFIDGSTINPLFNGTVVGVRPADVDLKGTGLRLPGVITDVRHMGIRGISIFRVKLGREEIFGRIPLNRRLMSKSRVNVRLKRFHVFDRNSGERIKSFPEELPAIEIV